MAPENWKKIEGEDLWRNKDTGSEVRISEEPPGFAFRYNPGNLLLGSPRRLGTSTEKSDVRDMIMKWMRDNPGG